jgi:hypothetical protein
MAPAVWIDNIRRVALGCDRVISGRRCNPGLNTVNQDDPAARRMCGDQQQRVVAAGSLTPDCAGGEATSRARLKPLYRKIHRVTLRAQP